MTTYTISAAAIPGRHTTHPGRGHKSRLIHLLSGLLPRRPGQPLPTSLIDDVDPLRRGSRPAADLYARLRPWLY
jgi:hypothetical protein